MQIFQKALENLESFSISKISTNELTTLVGLHDQSAWIGFELQLIGDVTNVTAKDTKDELLSYLNTAMYTNINLENFELENVSVYIFHCVKLSFHLFENVVSICILVLYNSVFPVLLLVFRKN